MPLKLQAHIDSRIWSLQSTVSFFFLSSIWYIEVLFAFKLGLQRVYFFQNVRKMHFFPMFRNGVLSDFINLTQVHNFTVSAQDSFTFRRLSVFTVSFTGILQLLMQIMKRFVPSY